MDKLNIALEMVIAGLKGGYKLSAKEAFATIDEIEIESIKRGLYFPAKCDRCGGDIHVIDAASATDRYYIVKCDCRNKRGIDLKTVKWEFINDN